MIVWCTISISLSLSILSAWNIATHNIHTPSSLNTTKFLFRTYFPSFVFCQFLLWNGIDTLTYTNTYTLLFFISWTLCFIVSFRLSRWSMLAKVIHHMFTMKTLEFNLPVELNNPSTTDASINPFAWLTVQIFLSSFAHWNGNGWQKYCMWCYVCHLKCTRKKIESPFLLISVVLHICIVSQSFWITLLSNIFFFKNKFILTLYWFSVWLQCLKFSHHVWAWNFSLSSCYFAHTKILCLKQLVAI